MAHPIMFDEADPVLGRLRALALAFPDAAEKVSHGHPAFFTTKIFGYYGGSVKVDGVYQRHEPSLLVLIDPGEREALLAEDRCYVPAYLGAYGWIGVDLTDDTDWDEVKELLDASYRRTAGPRRVAVLDSRRSDPGPPIRLRQFTGGPRPHRGPGRGGDGSRLDGYLDHPEMKSSSGWSPARRVIGPT
jgi:hypothetical protein